MKGDAVDSSITPFMQEQEILDILSKAAQHRHVISLWQKTGASRILDRAIVKSIDAKTKLLIIKPHNQVTFRQSADKMTYFHRQAIDFIFKAVPKYVTDLHINLPLPTEAYIREKRDEHRIILKDRANNRVKITDYSGKMEFPNIDEVSAFDISQGGLSFLVLAPEAPEHLIGGQVIISKIGAIEFAEPLEARILYISKSEYKTPNSDLTVFRVGAKLVNPLSDRYIIELSFDFGA